MTTRSRIVFAAAPLLVALALAAPRLAQAQEKVLVDKSQITFSIKEMGVSVDGRFAKWTADVTFDPKKPTAGKMAFTIDTASASFGAPETDAEVPKPTWFNVAKFPTATFVSSAITQKMEGRFEVTGKLTVKGTSRDITIPFAVAQTGTVAAAVGQFMIKRLDYKIGEGEWTDTSTLADEVTVKFRLVLSGVPAP